MRTQIERMLKDAEKGYSDAARMHFDGKVNFYSGQIAALKKVLELLD